MSYLITIGCIIAVLAIILGIYLRVVMTHESELKKFSHLEARFKAKDDTREKARLNTTPCDISNLDTPRDCYFNSDYRCKWDKVADRCNLHTGFFHQILKN